MTSHKSIFYQAQEQVCEALNEDEVLSGKVTFISENSKDIDYEIKNALGRQGIVGVVMTPDATYQGVNDNGAQVWDLRDFTVQVVENPVVNRGQPAYANITAHDAAARAAAVLASPTGGLFGQYCPTTIEQGEDDGLIVAQAKFNVQVRSEDGEIPNKYRSYWYVDGGSTTSEQGLYEAGTEIIFTSDGESKVLEYVSVNGIEVSDTSSYGSTSYTYTTPAEDVFVKVVFAVPVVIPKATFTFTGVNVSCDHEDGEYEPGVVVHFTALSAESMSDGIQQAMLSTFIVNGTLDLDVARTFARPSLSATTWSYELQEGDNVVSATADILPYWKDRTCWWLAYNDSNGALQWRGSLHREEFQRNSSNTSLYITGPNAISAGADANREIKELVWNGMDWRDIEEVFVPCYQYNTNTGSTYSPGNIFHPYAFANMPSLRKVTVDVMRESDSTWYVRGRTSGGGNWNFDTMSFVMPYTTTWTSLPRIAGAFWNCPNFEELDYGFDRGGFINFDTSINLVNCFYNTKLKDLRLRVYITGNPLASGAVGTTQPLLTNMLNGVKNESPTTFQFEYVKQSDGYGADSKPINTFTVGGMSPIFQTTPYYAPRVQEMVYPALSEAQQDTISAFTTAANRQVITVNATRNFYRDLKRIIVPNWSPNTTVGATNTFNPSDLLREVVLSAGSTVPATLSAYWQNRVISANTLSTSGFPTTPSIVSVYVPDALYNEFLADTNWSQISARGYELKNMSEWQNAPLSAL